MIKTYIKVAFRSMFRNKTFTLISILGLSVGMVAFLLIMHYVQFERSYESSNKNADNIYRVTLDVYNGSKFEVTDCETFPPFGPAIKAKMPEVEEFVRIQRMEQITQVSYSDKNFREEKIYAVDPSVFSVFDLDLIRGNINTALKASFQLVITESMAIKYFGNLEAIGKRIRVKPYKESLEVVGVIKDIPSNTHMKMDLMISISSLKTWGWDLTSWNGNNNYTYLKMVPNLDLAKFNEKLKAFSKAQIGDEVLVAEPIRSIHLYSNKTFEPEVNGSAQTVNFLLIISILIILIASVNYINLTTAKSIERAREIGIRKIVGSSKGSIIIQSVTEFLLINIFATLLALILVYFVSPFYQDIIGEDIPVNLLVTTGFWTNIGMLFLLNILFSGVYPALVLSSITPSAITGNKFTSTSRKHILRKVLVVGQFAITLILLSSTIIIYKQVRYMKGQSLGMDPEQVLVLRAPSIDRQDSLGKQKVDIFRNALYSLPEVKEVSASESLPGVSLHELSTTSLTRFEADPKSGHTYYLYGIDSTFISLMGIEMKAGSNFSSGLSRKSEIIVNEEAARLLGFKDAEEAIGRKVSLWGSPTIIGVVKNYHQQSLKEKYLPMIHWYHDAGNGYLSLKVRTTDLKTTVAKVESIWKSTMPGYNFDYYFLDDMFNQQYQADLKFGKMTAIFSGIAIFLACLGLLGLISYSTQQRAKEIGIRKVLGATLTNITSLLTSEYVRMILISVVIALPAAYYAMSTWLQDFAYRIDLDRNIWVFALSGLVTLFIAMSAISFQSIKAALMNPVKSLRSE